MKKRDLFYLLRDLNDEDEILVNIFDNEKCLDCSNVFDGNASIVGVSKNGQDFAIDIKIKKNEDEK